MTILNYDASGFIVGIDQMNKGIGNVHDDTQEIVQILKAQRQVNDTRMNELTRAVRLAAQRMGSSNNINNSRDRASSSAGRISRNAPTSRPNSGSSDSRSADTSAANRRNRITSSSTRASDSSSSNTNNSSPSQSRRDSAANRERDGNGRFTGGDSTRTNPSGFGGGTGGMGGTTNTSGVDPLVDSFNEARDLLSPLARGAGLVGRGAKFSIAKMRSLKRREPLPRDQDRHNNENEKLLDKIWKAIVRGGGSGGGGRSGLGRVLGGLGLGAAGAAGGGALGLLKKLGGKKGLGIIGSLIGAGSLAMDWGNLDHQGKSEGVGSLAGAGAGGLAGMKLGAMAGAFAGPIGVGIGGAIGGLAGAWLGSDAGQALGKAASPHIQSWTDALIRYNLPDKMSTTWNDKIKPFFVKLDSAAGRINAWIEGKASGFSDFMSGGLDGVTSANAGANGASAAKLSDLQTKRQKMVYDSFRNAGLSDAQSRAMTAEVGRENGYQDKYLFGGHSDPANNEYNLGMFSWQKDRGKKLYKHLNDKGLIKNGKIVQSQEALNEQARFSVNEIQTNKAYSRTKKEFLDNPNVSYNKANEVLGNNYIRWRYTDPKYTKHHTYRDQYKASIDKQLKPIEDTGIIDEAKSKAADIGNAVKNAVAPDKPKQSGKRYGGSILDKKTRQNIKSKVQSTIPASDDALIYKSSLGVAAGGKSGAYTPSSLPTKPMLDIPKMPKISQRLDSGSDNKPMIIQSSNDTISQNVSDRGLAHAITGGIGKDRYYG